MVLFKNFSCFHLSATMAFLAINQLTFIRDNMTNSIEFPEEFKSDFSLVISNKLIGSVDETLAR